MTDKSVKPMTKDERERIDRICIYSSDFACTTTALKKMMFLLDNYNFEAVIISIDLATSLIISLVHQMQPSNNKNKLRVRMPRLRQSA